MLGCLPAVVCQESSTRWIPRFLAARTTTHYNYTMMNIRTLALLAMATTTLAVTDLPAQEQHRSPSLEEYTLGSPKALRRTSLRSLRWLGSDYVYVDSTRLVLGSPTAAHPEKTLLTQDEFLAIIGEATKGAGAKYFAPFSVVEGKFLSISFGKKHYLIDPRTKKQVAAFEKNPNLIMVGSNILEKNTEFTALKKVPETTAEIRQYSKMRNPFNNPSSMMKKEYILKAGNYRKFRYLEDYDLTMRLLHDNPTKDFLNIQEPLVVMQTNDSSYLRRGGFLYVKTDFMLQLDFYRRRDITLVEFVRNIFLRNAIRILPNSIRKWVYKKKMREEVEVIKKI